MVDILHRYVLKFVSGEYYPLFFDGDQLTRERACGVKDARLQSDEEGRKLQGCSLKLQTGMHFPFIRFVIYN